MKVPLLDLKAQYMGIRSELDSAIARVIESQHFILGPEVEKLEQALCSYLGCSYAVGVSSGTDALLVALMALDINPGDEVIVPDYSFFATAGVVSRLSAVPVFCDIDPVTFNIDPEEIKKKITKKTQAIIPVHLYGQAADMGPIMAIAEAEGIPVVEDAAQAIGARYKDGRCAGTIGKIGCFSFFPSKNLGCFGDGGLVITNDQELAEKLRILRVHGSKPKYYHKIVGGNFRLDALQAAVVSAKLPHLDQWTAKRRDNAALYNKLFIESGLAQDVGRVQLDAKNKALLPLAVYEVPSSPSAGAFRAAHTLSENLQCPSPNLNSAHSNLHIYNQYVIRVQNRDALISHFKAKEIGSEIYYPVPFHKQECFADLKYKVQSKKEKVETAFTVSDAAAATSLALPIYPELKPEQQEFVVQSIREFVRS